MNHYQKLGALAARIIGFTMVIYGFSGIVMFIMAFLAHANNPSDSVTFWFLGGYVIIGLIIFMLATPIGRLLGRGSGDN